MNKLLISIEVPSIEQNFDLFIPINKKMGTIKKYVIKSIHELSGGILKEKTYLFLIYTLAWNIQTTYTSKTAE